LALDGYGQLHATARFIPGERAVVTHWVVGWAPKAGLDDLEKKGSLLAGPEVETQIIQPID